jgi:hypothetical protein
MKKLSVFSILLLMVVSSFAADPQRDIPEAAPLSQMLLDSLCGCWQKSTLTRGQVCRQIVRIHPVLGRTAIHIESILSKYNDITLNVNLVARPLAGTLWSCLWMDSSGHLQPVSMTLHGRTFYIAAEFPESTQRFYISRKKDGTLFVALKREIEDISTFLYHNTMDPCPEEEASME